MIANLSSTPFTSTYKFKYEANNGVNSGSNHVKVDEFAFKNNIQYNINYNDVDCSKPNGSEQYATGILKAPDYKDMDVEKFCKLNGIQFEKTPSSPLVSQKAVLSRCVLPQEAGNKKIAFLDVEKFEDASSLSPFGNVEACEDLYVSQCASQIHDVISSGEDIVVPELYINEPSSGRLPASFVFNQTDKEPNQCLYFAMKNIGMTKVPVAVDRHTYEVGCEMGLFE